MATELRVDTVVYGRFAVKIDTRVLEYGRLSEGPAVKASFSIPNSLGVAYFCQVWISSISMHHRQVAQNGPNGRIGSDKLGQPLYENALTATACSGI
jgi:hypothetical protein